jgi:alcohol dehydrogenase
MDRNYVVQPLPAIFLGRGAFENLPEAIESYVKGKKALIVADKTEFGKIAAERIVKKLADRALEFVRYCGAEPNPKDVSVYEGAESYKNEGCDFLISIGGGSSHDCAKAIGIIVTRGGQVRNYFGIDKVRKRIPPVVTVNTTAGTGSEVSRAAVITEVSTRTKRDIVDINILPTVAIDDPMLMMTMPPRQTAYTGLDALIHAIEAFTSIDANQYSDMFSFRAIELAGRHLRRAVMRGDDLEAREGMCYAALYAGIAILNVGCGMAHSLGTTLGGFYDWPHGLCVAIVLPHVMEFNLPAATEKYAKIAKALGTRVEGLSTRDAAEAAIASVKTILDDLAIARKWGDIGGKSDDIPLMTEKVMGDYDFPLNPRKATNEDVLDLFSRSFG